MLTAAAISMLAGSVAAEFSSASPESHKMMFEAFKAQHGRRYKTQDEENTRFKAFVSNLAVVDARNKAERSAGGSAMHGITKFADWTDAEFQSLLGYRKSNQTTVKYVPVAPYTGSATSVDWAGVYTTPIKDQGYCGSCWAFAASEQIESDSMRTLGTNYILAPEQLVECDRTSMGCNGGLQERAYSYVERTGGIEEEVNYPYTSGVDGSTSACSSDSSKYVLTVTDYANVKGEDDMTSYVKSTGPLSIAVDASTWSSYTGGVMTACPTNINHAVQAVGVDTGSNGYWKVRNSWSADWGESGYIRLAYGKDTCGLTYDVTYTTTAKV